VNLLFRLLWLLIAVRFRGRVNVLGPSVTRFRCLPTHLDALGHMNNGKYLSILDLARIDLLMRSGVTATMAKRGWYGVVASETIRFRRSLKLFQAFTVETAVLGWDDKAFVVQQRFQSGETPLSSSRRRA
jgi:acyl-CoA thioesterase FadM